MPHTSVGRSEASSPDAIDRAHLRDPGDQTFTIARHSVSSDLDGLARRFWIPVWDVPAGRESPQRVLQFPVCLIVVSDSYARFYGVARGVSETTLRGHGWAVGLLLQPAAGALLTNGPVAALTDRYVDLAEIATNDPTLVDDIRAAMAPGPADVGAQARARLRVERFLRAYLPVDAEGRLVNALVDAVETDPELLRVAQLCERFAMTERTVQRLTRRRLGLSPKWLIRRRRLHEAASRLRDAGVELAALAADLGYTDQAHFTRDFRAATGLTPGSYAGLWREQTGRAPGTQSGAGESRAADEASAR